MLVLTLLGPEPAVRARTVALGRRRFEMTLTVLHGTWPATSEAVGSVLAELLARRPSLVVEPVASTGGAS